MTVRIDSFAEAEQAAREYARLASELERLEERLKEFAERRRELVGKERALGPLVVGFEKVAPQVKVPREALDWLRKTYDGEFVRFEPVPKRPELRRFLSHTFAGVVEEFREHGIVLVEGYERFYLKLVRKTNL